MSIEKNTPNEFNNLKFLSELNGILNRGELSEFVEIWGTHIGAHLFQKHVKKFGRFISELDSENEFKLCKYIERQQWVVEKKETLDEADRRLREPENIAKYISRFVNSMSVGVTEIHLL